MVDCRQSAKVCLRNEHNWAFGPHEEGLPGLTESVVNAVSFFTNFETHKLNTDYADVWNVVILSLLLVLTLISLRKENSAFLDRTQSDELKGIAILLVIVGHLWLHASDETVPIFGDYGVAIFLLLSGFGLTASLATRNFEWREFARRRIKRVMIPYWFTTIIWITADWFVLDRVYSVQDIACAFAGVNFSLALRKLDYARWYITLLLVWYGAFALSVQFLSRRMVVWTLFGFGFVMASLRLVEVWPFGSPLQMFAFPLGALLACHREWLSILLLARKWFLVFLGLCVGIIVTGSFCLWFLKQTQHPELLRYAVIDSIGLGFCAFCILCVAALGTRNYVSAFLCAWGKISYEAFLIHGPLLIKYNPIMGPASGPAVAVYFAAFLGMIWILSYCARLLIVRLQERASVMVSTGFNCFRSHSRFRRALRDIQD
jgi:peptidoglycan/LPS O-acetylase OafA/YrhL